MVIHQNNNMLGKFLTFDLKYVYSLYFKANALNSYLIILQKIYSRKNYINFFVIYH